MAQKDRTLLAVIGDEVWLMELLSDMLLTVTQGHDNRGTVGWSGSYRRSSEEELPCCGHQYALITSNRLSWSLYEHFIPC